MRHVLCLADVNVHQNKAETYLRVSLYVYRLTTVFYSMLKLKSEHVMKDQVSSGQCLIFRSKSLNLANETANWHPFVRTASNFMLT